MIYLTLEVEIDQGKVKPKEPSLLPEKGSGLLTIFSPDENGPAKFTPLQVLDALQKHLKLDSAKATQWMAGVRELRC